MTKRRDYRQIFPLELEEIQKLVGRLRQDRKGCWLWKSEGYSGGYGRITLRGKRWMAHAIAYELFKGHAEKGQVVDHLCRRPRCCNPEHLEAVTSSVNTLRGARPRGKKHYHGKKTHCKHGHPFSGKNLAWQVANGYRKRVCRTCMRRWLRESRARRREAAGRRGGQSGAKERKPGTEPSKESLRQR